MKTPNITTNRTWSAESVRTTCIRHNFYTAGDCEDYEHMLNWVGRLYPNTENLYLIAQDIQKHSDDQTITNIMFCLEQEAVTTTFEIDGQDDI